jgi:hypothetical protein
VEDQGSFGIAPWRLASMLDLEAEGKGLWQSDELGAVLQHQLAARWDAALGAPGAVSAGGFPEPAPQDAPIGSVADLLSHPHPPVEWLERLKEFAKDCHRNPDRTLPDEVTAVLYLLSIVVARIKCPRRISRLDDQSLRYSLDWALSQPWLDATSRKIFKEGLEACTAEIPRRMSAECG